MSHLERLRELTERLPVPFLDTLKDCGAGFTEIEAGDGEVMLFGLLKERRVAVSHGFMAAGSTMVPHKHAEHEWFIVYEGAMRVLLPESDEEVLLKPADSYYLPPKTPHAVVWPENTRMIVVTIPAAEGFPDAP